MRDEQFYPCLMNDDTGKISRRVGPAMSFAAAVDYLKQNHPGAWQRQRATAQPVTHEMFAGGSADQNPA